MIFDVYEWNFRFKGTKTLPISLVTDFAVFSPFDSAKTDGPDPDIPVPSDPLLLEVFFKSLKAGIRSDLYGSTNTSIRDLLMSL